MSVIPSQESKKNAPFALRSLHQQYPNVPKDMHDWIQVAEKEKFTEDREDDDEAEPIKGMSVVEVRQYCNMNSTKNSCRFPFS